MEVTLEDLKIQGDEIISRIGEGYDVTIIHNGKAYAKIIPLADEITNTDPDDSETELFGLWKDRTELDDVDLYVRRMRQGRKILFRPDYENTNGIITPAT